MIDWQQQPHTVVIGLGQTGLSCVRYLLQRGIVPTVADTRETPPNLSQLAELWQQFGVEPGALHCGELTVECVLAADVIVLSPGVDRKLALLQLAADAGITLVGDIELYAQASQRPVIAITGSNGKSTVTQLVGELLAAAGKRAAVGGNIGTPALSLLDQQADVDVLELSSFQLESTYSLRPDAAVILNISADHLDRYLSLADYINAKQRIFQNAKHIVINRDDSHTRPLQKTQASVSSFGQQADKHGFCLREEQGSSWLCLGSEKLLRSDDIALQGVHNLMNIAAALALVQALAIDVHSVLDAVRVFPGLPHRCQLLKQQQQVAWVNDSKATNVGAAEAAIYGLRPLVAGKLVLIAGGDGKGADFTSFADALKQVDELITLGRDGPRIAELKAGSHQVQDLTEAVALAAELVGQQGTVLLSPACASFDMFNGFAHRGEVFSDSVEAWYGSH
ncbi:UDP-N-acetylmuramoyl-L-alanine--D-glutamate ligase [Idiomarina xiamenensis]|uniref:UDP-N-acetylmuramoylalanine--D-glutamate ligase n=1 Tax=Idiomarina xiamenensis 10-D-4 TaxID=740709 RepID=K2JPB5_9GAMM|nr:UDP-N-acetylmuramoyl-L-alanine--D-glutamate ligase [Idiomarina xiamenensis]EKE85336.1 UDP-N-acetylmuramoylalanine--D-glutamate ligase [Idiomarina xiamenensis 10-D-4]